MVSCIIGAEEAQNGSDRVVIACTVDCASGCVYLDFA